MCSIKKDTITGVKWSAIERFSVQAVTFVIGIILARLLTPEDYASIAMLSIFMAISSAFIDSGMANALIRKDNRTAEDCSVVFYFNIFVSILMYVILFFLAPFVASFYNLPILTSILRVIAFNLIIGSLFSIQTVLFTIKINFKILAVISLVSAIFSGAIAIIMAYNGFGVWSLVWQGIISSVIRLILSWCLSSWRPMLCFSKESFKNLFSFASKLLVSGLLHTIYSNIISLIIGKYGTPSELGYYSRGDSLANFPSTNINGILQRVSFPIFAKIQGDGNVLIGAYRKYIKYSSLIIFFLMCLLVALAKPLVIFLLTEKWLNAILLLQILCFAYMFDHICSINLNLLQVKGRSDLFLKLEIIKKTISIVILIISIPFGVVAICISRVIYTQIAVYINTYYTGKLFNVGYFTQVKDFINYFVFSIIACIPAFILTFFIENNILLIIIGGLTSISIYFALLYLRRDVIFMVDIFPLLRKYLKFNFRHS